MVDQKYIEIKSFYDSCTVDLNTTEKEVSVVSKHEMKYSAMSRLENGSQLNFKNPY